MEYPIMEEPIVEEPLEDTSMSIEEVLTEEEIRGAFDTLLKNAQDEDRQVRDTYLNTWTKLEYIWNNILDIFWDVSNSQWAVPDWDSPDLIEEVPPRLINIYRPHGEAIVAALSITVPPVYYHPDDADNADDVEAARGYRSITELLQLHNNSSLQIIKALVILFNQGTIFGYCYPQANPKNGTIQKPKIEYTDITEFETYCPQCGNPLDAGMGQPQEVYQCEVCGYQGPAESTVKMEKFPQIVGYDETPKTLIKQRLFSGLNVKVPAYVTEQADCGYLLLEFLQSTAMLRSVFNEQAEKINSQRTGDWENFSKIPLQYFGSMPDNASTVSCLWVRPWQFYQLETPELVERLVAKYPTGAYAIFVNKEFMIAYEENMDDHWTISSNPMGANLYSRPLGENLSTIQEIRASLVDIELQTAEFGIPEMFVDSNVLDLQKYGQGRSKPGMVTAVKARAGQAIGDAFHTTTAAVLSPEIAPLKGQMDHDAQFVTGSFPSVYGGAATGGSKTAKEYTESRAAALQRLGTIWKILSEFWADFQATSAVLYANILKDLGEDERFTKRDGNNFINVWIRNSSLQGKIGRVEPESSDQLPVTWAQKKDQMQMLLATNNEQILSILGHPNNVGLIKESLGLKDLYMPGEYAKLRQNQELTLTVQGIQVPINVEVDNHEIHIEICKNFLEGPLGEGVSEEGKMATMDHLSQHLQYLAMLEQQQMMAQQQAAQQGSAPGNESQKGEK